MVGNINENQSINQSISLSALLLHVWFQVMFGFELCFCCISPCLKFVSCVFYESLGICVSLLVKLL
jgi:uncharacterized membrane protein YagU involved in acid resistance